MAVGQCTHWVLSVSTRMASKLGKKCRVSAREWPARGRPQRCCGNFGDGVIDR